jgi:hypothetical protein
MGTSVAYDRNAHELVLFGGYIAALGGSFINYDDTWTFDGVNWTQQHPAASPPSGVDVQLAEDPHGDVVLFGSSGNSTDPSCQTWVWAQGNWLQQQPAHSPPCRQLAGFALDPSSNRDVLFGGLGYPDLTTLLGDTSTWDGTDWSPAASTATPLPRWEMGMAPDVAAHGVLLYGGTNCPALGQNVPYCSPAQTVNAGPDESTYTDTWLWTGGVWQQLSSTPGGPSVFPALASLPDGAGVLAFSGSAIYGDWSTNASWIFGSQPSAPVPEFPAGVGAWALGASAIAALATRRRWRLRR